MREAHGSVLANERLGINAMRLHDFLLERPRLTVSVAAERLGVAFPTANKLVERFCELELLEEITGRKRNRVFSYAPYLALFEEPKSLDVTPVQSTEAA
jgi:Fic family protein